MNQIPTPFGTSTPNIFYYERWRNSFLRVILRAALVLGFFLLVIPFFSDTETILLIIYGVSYLGLIIANFVKLSFRVRAGLFVFLLYALGVSGLIETGIRGDARVFFPIFIIMTTMLFRQRSLWIAIVLTFLATVGVGIPLFSGYITILNASRGFTLGTWDAWAMFLLETIILSYLVTTGLRMLQDEFNLAEKYSNQTLRELNAERSKLETRVEERTKDLERRATQLQVAADVGSAATRLRDLDQLLNQTTSLISERFNFYHVGIFLLDDNSEFAVLKSANSIGGQRMLARGHQLKVGQVGIVGYVTGLGEARIALDVGKDATFFDNPDLPETRSEMALPLMVGNRILGALDVQSREEAAFSQEDISILKVLADQVAIAIDNARLFSDTQAALENTRRAYAEVSKEGWRRLLRERQTEIGYISQPNGDVLPITHEVSKESLKALSTRQAVLSNEDTTLHVPIFIRDEPIGVIRLDKLHDGSRWTEEEINLADTLSVQLGIALESARLYQDISQRAERENVISDISSKINSSIQMDVILRNTVQELGHALGDSEIILQLGSHIEKGNKRG